MHGTAVVLALGSAGFFGLALVLTQFGLRQMPPLRGAAISVPTTAVAFLLASPVLVDWAGFDLRAAAIFAGVGMLFPVSVTVLTFRANQRLGPHVAGALGNLAPLFAVLFAVLLLGEAAGPVRIAGILVVVAGATVLALASGRAGGTTAWASLPLPVLAALVRGGVQPAVKTGFAFWPDPFAAACIGYAVSAVVVAALAVTSGEGAPAPGRRRGVPWFAAVGLCNGAAVVTMYAALANGPVVLVAPLVASYPLATLAFGAALLRRTRIGMRVAAGVAITVAGVAILLAAR